MRAVKVLLILSLLVASVVVLVAQEQQEVISFNRSITSVVDSPYGFKITYQDGVFNQRELYIPTDWIFRDRVALVSYSNERSAPFLQMYFGVESQALEFVRIVLPRSPEHPIWSKTYSDDIEQKFSEALFGSL